MKMYRMARTAMTALRRNPMRTLLTNLGIVIGVGAVIAMMEIGTGSSAAIQKTISTMGANVLNLSPGAASSGGVSFGSGSTTTLTPEDAEAIMLDCPAVRDVAPLVHARTQVVYGNRNWVQSYIYGSIPLLFGCAELDHWRGRTFHGTGCLERQQLENGDSKLLGQHLHWWRVDFAATALGPIWLGHYQPDIGMNFCQLLQGW